MGSESPTPELREGNALGRVLVTGGCGLIGSALIQRLTAAGHETVNFDLSANFGKAPMDITDIESVAAAMEKCTGVVHLAAVSRVVWGQRDPVRCWEVNVKGTRNVLAAAADREARAPWVLVASSREVYGQASSFPVPEWAPYRPLNAYARSKVEVENLAASSRRDGLHTSVVRFSGVYGAIADHADRVAPGFARLAAEGGTLRVDGEDTTLDFTHIEDVAAGLQMMTEVLAAGAGPLPPVHFVSGRGTTLRELADVAVEAAGSGIVEVGPPRDYDVSKFIGDPSRAEQLLGWRSSTVLEEGMKRLVEDFRSASATA
jgi:UDP-glucose 4-epimerase